MRVMEDAAALTHLGQALASERALTADLQTQLQHTMDHHHMLEMSPAMHTGRLLATGPASPAHLMKPAGSIELWSSDSLPRLSYGPRVDLTRGPYTYGPPFRMSYSRAHF